MAKDFEEQSRFLYENLRLRTLPVGVRFLKSVAELPEKARRPSLFLKKKVTICQSMTMARNYGWQLGITSDDLVCPLAALAFGFTSSADPLGEMAESFLVSQYKRELEKSAEEVRQMCFLDRGEYGALLLSPLRRMREAADTVVVYGNPGQISRIVQAATYDSTEKIQGLFGGKVECPEYLIRPMRTGRPRVVLPGPGDRIFSMTQDDEMIFAFPGDFLEPLLTGLREAGSKAGARYPIPFYQNFQPEFPAHYQDLAKRFGL